MAGHAVLNLDESLAVTENILTVEGLAEIPHKVMMGLAVLPGMEEEQGRRREERLWKCLTRSHLLERRDRMVLTRMAKQVEEEMNKQPDVCTTTPKYGRQWLRNLLGVQEE